jgi:RNA polymerase sigma-70 factor (ECF subfamily)
MHKDSCVPEDGKSIDPFQEWVEAARGGCPEAMGRIIQECRAYLLTIANKELESGFGPKVGASDIVQETMLSAHRCIEDFRGSSREELLAWLRGILLNDIKQTRRRFRAAGRDVGREQALADESGARPAEQVAACDATPSADAMAREEVNRLQQAIDRLSADDREVIDLRNWQRLSFADIGQRTGRSAEAARKLWSRAIARLQSELEKLQ